MRKIVEKNLLVEHIPVSIQLPQNERNNLGKRTINEQKRRTTHLRRLQVIRLKRCPTIDKFSERYKQDDVKQMLKVTYLNKCGYCEQYSESWHVEHYRPKNGGYEYLTYSWDNLIFCCPTCNIYKSKKFDIRGVKAVYKDEDLANIHTLCQTYNATEQPLLLHPEYDSAEEDFVFDENGQILTGQITNERLIYTIESVCKLNRKPLIDRRKEIVIDKLLKDIDAVVLKNADNKEVLNHKIEGIIEAFVSASQCESEEFTVFRKYVVTHFLAKMI